LHPRDELDELADYEVINALRRRPDKRAQREVEARRSRSKHHSSPILIGLFGFPHFHEYYFYQQTRIWFRSFFQPYEIFWPHGVDYRWQHTCVLG
jgi:hypothetical protein